MDAALKTIRSKFGSPTDMRLLMEAIIWRYENCAKWRALPERFGKWNSVFQTYGRWAKAGRWQRLFEALRDAGEPQLGMAFIDGTIVRAHQKAAGANAAGRVSRKVAGATPSADRAEASARSSSASAMAAAA